MMLSGIRPAIRKDAFRNIAVAMGEWTDRNIKTEGGKVDGGWPPFKHGGRLKWIEGEGAIIDSSAKLLQDTGTLKNKTDIAWKSMNATVFTAVDYASFHDEGIPGKLPQRRILPNQDEAMPLAVRVIKWTLKELNKK